MVELAAFLVVIWLGVPLALILIAAAGAAVWGALYAAIAVVSSPFWAIGWATERWSPRTREALRRLGAALCRERSGLKWWSGFYAFLGLLWVVMVLVENLGS